MFVLLLLALTSSVQAGEKRVLNLGLTPVKKASNTPVSAPVEAQGENVRVFPGGGAEDLLKVTRPLDSDSEDAIREGDQRQVIETQRLQNQLPNGLSNDSSRISTPLNAQGR